MANKKNYFSSHYKIEKTNNNNKVTNKMFKSDSEIYTYVYSNDSA